MYDGQIRSGRTAVDMPALQLAALQRSVMASCTGPCGGLCQLDPEKDSPTHDRGTCVYRCVSVALNCSWNTIACMR